MTTSGITIKQLSGSDMINAAMRKLGVLAKGSTADSTDITNGLQALNLIVGAMRTLGMPIWARKEQAITMVDGTSLYQIGVGKTINVAYPNHILQAFITDTGSGSKMPVDVVSNYNFNLLNGESTGTPTAITYQPFVNYGEVRMWPTPDATAVADTTLKIVYHSPFQYFNASTDTADFPEEWQLPLVYALARDLAPEWGVPLDERAALSQDADRYLGLVLSSGYEDASMFISPARRW